MTVDKAKELLSAQAGPGSGYHRNATGPVLAELQREHDQQVEDRLIVEFDSEEMCGLKPYTRF